MPTKLNYLFIVAFLILSSCATPGEDKEEMPKEDKKERLDATCSSIAENYSKDKSPEKIYGDALRSFRNKSKFKHSSKPIPDTFSKKEMYVIYRDLHACLVETKGQRNEYYDAVSRFVSRIYDKYAPAEKKTFLKRSGGRKICGSLFSIAMNNDPVDGCLYDNTRTEVLDVLQVSKDGYLYKVGSSAPANSASNSRPLFVFKDEMSREYFDGSTSEGGYYYHIGSYSYENILGAGKTIPSFKKLKGDPLKDLYFYNGR